MDTQGAAMDQTPQFGYLGRLTTVIAASLIEAKALAHEGNFGREYDDVVRHTRELYNELLEELVIAGPSGSEFTRGLADSIGVRLDDLERGTAPVVAQVRLDDLERGTAPVVAQVQAAGLPEPDPQPTDDRAELWHLWSRAANGA